MKKKTILLSVVLLLLLILVYYRPIPMVTSAPLPDQANIILCGTEDGKSVNKTYVLNGEEVKSLHTILEKYDYHRKLTTFIAEQELSNTASDTFVIHYDGRIISVSGTPEILIDGREYGLGYFVSDKGAELAAELQEMVKGM